MKVSTNDERLISLLNEAEIETTSSPKNDIAQIFVGDYLIFVKNEKLIKDLESFGVEKTKKLARILLAKKIDLMGLITLLK